MRLSKPISEAEFARLSTFVEQQCGIKMPASKKTLLESRLQKRLRALNMTSFRDYCNYLFSPAGQEHEVIFFIDVMTTNKTDFFREPAHFEFLRTTALPEILSEKRPGEVVKVWSAGCSSGEEPYTIAMVMSEFAHHVADFDYLITATDISTHVLEKAVTGVYPTNRVEGVPLGIKKKYFLKSKDPNLQTVRLVPAIRSKVKFQRLNFMDASYSVQEQFYDIIFCRNVLIYFERPLQEQVINKLCSKLRSGGYFFLGHSESIMELNVPLVQLRPTIFQRV